MVSSWLTYTRIMLSNNPSKPLLIFLQGFFLGLLGLSGFYYLLLFAVTLGAGRGNRTPILRLEI